MSGRMRTLKQLNEERLVSLFIHSLSIPQDQAQTTKFIFTLGNKRNIWNRIKNTNSNGTSKQIKSWIQLDEVIHTSAPKKPSIVSLTLTFPASHDTKLTEFEKQRKLLLATTHDQVSDQLWLWPLLCNPVRNCADLNFVKKTSLKRTRPL